MRRPFAQVDVFTTRPGLGNALAVVLDGGGLDTADMQRFAHWTNLSETTFLLPPKDPGADYRVRIFTPSTELPFAGHPTLGSCHAWLEAGGMPRDPSTIVQECGAGLVSVRRSGDELAFAAPPLYRSEAELVGIAAEIGLERAAIVDAQWGDNGPGWVIVLLESAEAVLAVVPGAVRHELGIVGLHAPGAEVDLEVRALYPQNGSVVEDPVTGSLNASAAGWLLSTGRLEAPYLARQGTAIGRDGRIRVTRDDDGTVWTGGRTVTLVAGTVELQPAQPGLAAR
jgi:PhzF family phenazine biosynthesis protein